MLTALFLIFAPLFSLTEDSVTLYFAGDLMQHGPQTRAARVLDGSYDYTECFSYVKEEVSAADFAIANLEVPLGGKPYTGYPQFSAPDEYVLAIREAGFDILMTANNHAMDKRTHGVNRTIDILDSLGIYHFGTYKSSVHRSISYPLIIEKNNIRIALLAYTYDTNGIPVTPPTIVNTIDRQQILEDIRSAQILSPDAIIACMHWGVEYQTLPQQSERELAHWMLSQGVDHVIGTHPHVVQPMEVTTLPTTNNTVPDSTDQHLIVYSLGNYLSNQSPATTGQRLTDGGASVRLTLKKKLGKTRLASCDYLLNWVSRPQVSGNKNYRIYPANQDTLSLNSTERKLMQTFLNNARKLFKKHNKGIDEAFFSKNIASDSKKHQQ